MTDFRTNKKKKPYPIIRKINTPEQLESTLIRYLNPQWRTRKIGSYKQLERELRKIAGRPEPDVIEKGERSIEPIIQGYDPITLKYERCFGTGCDHVVHRIVYKGAD